MQKRMKVFRPFEKGDRVVANQQAGFHKGAHGVIEYIAPNGDHWVLRDGAGKAVYYHAFELDFENPEDGYCMSDPEFDKALTAQVALTFPEDMDDAVIVAFEQGARWAWERAQEIFEKQSST
jgi:hypothetical protein